MKNFAFRLFGVQPKNLVGKDMVLLSESKNELSGLDF